MPLVPKPDSRGFQGFVYLCWFQKHAAEGERIVRTVGEAEGDTSLRLGTSFAYLAQLKAGEQVGQKRSKDSGYRLSARISGLDDFLYRLEPKAVADALGITVSRVVSWKAGAVAASTTTTSSTQRAVTERISSQTVAPHIAASAITLDQLEATLKGILSPLTQRIAQIEDRQIGFAKQLDRIEARSSTATTGGSAGLETALTSMINLLRELPDRLVQEQTAKVVSTLQDEGKHTGRAIRSLRETLEFQNREIGSVMAKVADSLTKLLASRDSVLMSLCSSLNSALNLVEEVPEEKPLTLPLSAVTGQGQRAATQQVVPAVPGNGNGGGK